MFTVMIVDHHTAHTCGSSVSPSSRSNRIEIQKRMQTHTCYDISIVNILHLLLDGIPISLFRTGMSYYYGYYILARVKC